MIATKIVDSQTFDMNCSKWWERSTNNSVLKFILKNTLFWKLTKHGLHWQFSNLPLPVPLNLQVISVQGLGLPRYIPPRTTIQKSRLVSFRYVSLTKWHECWCLQEINYFNNHNHGKKICDQTIWSFWLSWFKRLNESWFVNQNHYSLNHYLSICRKTFFCWNHDLSNH